MFEDFPKIPRLSRECVITEKIDGTNAQVLFEPVNPDKAAPPGVLTSVKTADGWSADVFAGSRTRWVTPKDDNYGFAAWVMNHAQELYDVLGYGRHFGEWWGSGVYRGYGLQNGEKRFSLFNTKRWKDLRLERDALWNLDKRTQVPDCCSVVPIVHFGNFHVPNQNISVVTHALEELREFGSYAAPGFDRPEGIVIYHIAAGQYFKKTLDENEEYKGKSNAG